MNFSLPVRAFDEIEFAFDEEVQSITSSTNSEIMVKVDFYEKPNPPDFFTRNDLGNCIGLSPIQDLNGFWSGKYSLTKSSIKWINRKFDQLKVYDMVHFGEYDIHMKFNFSDSGRLYGLEIVQDNLEYGNVNFDVSGDQINYWTKAVTGNWVEVVRGKLGRKSDGEIFTIFQTTVYDKGTPLYAFRGEATLVK